MSKLSPSASHSIGQGAEAARVRATGDGEHMAEQSLSLFDDRSAEPNGSAFKDPAFTENRAEPVHRWVPWIAGFSAGFVGDCLREYLAGVEPAQALVLDPFAGVGTTLVEAYRHGYNTAGFEINPYAALAARAKLGAGEVLLPAFETWIQAFALFMKETAGRGAAPDAA